MTRTTVFIHPRIRTLETEEPLDGAIVVREGRIAFLGSLDEARAVAGDGAEEVRLEGEALLPAFHDAHIHSGSMAAVRLGPELAGATSYTEVLERLRIFENENPGDGWIMGGRWDSNAWLDGAQPHRRDLDAIFGVRPVMLSTIDGHADWANSAALARAGIGAGTPDPVGGRIAKDATGEPTGLLLESASGPVDRVAREELVFSTEELLRDAQQHLLSLGIAHITDIDGEDVRSGYLALRDRGELRIRVHKMTRAGDLPAALADGRRFGDGDDWFTTGPVKIFADGALGPHTAHFHADFVGERGNRGIEVTAQQEIVELVRGAVDAGLGAAVHAIGDRANTLVLEAFETVAADARVRGVPLRIEHAQHIRPSDLDRFSELGVVASMQPTHCTSDYPLSVQLLGSRPTAHYPWRSLLDRGVCLAFGSDAPVEPADPFLGIHAAVTRQRVDGEPHGGREPDERITLTEALRAYTSAPAQAAGLVEHTGRLRTGMFADFITVDQDPYEVAEADLWRIRAEATVVGGEIVFQR